MLMRNFAIVVAVSLEMHCLALESSDSRHSGTAAPPLASSIPAGLCAPRGCGQRPLHARPLQRRLATPPVVANHRHEGNFYRKPSGATTERPAALYEHEVLHYEPVNRRRAYRSRRQSGTQAVRTPQQSDDDIAPEDESSAVDCEGESMRASVVHDQNSKRPQQRQHPDDDEDERETRYFHDIFMRFASASHNDSAIWTPAGDAEPVIARLFGHVEQSPRLLEERMESLDPQGNRYRGEVIWSDGSGGYGEHRWDMAQGKL